MHSAAQHRLTANTHKLSVIVRSVLGCMTVSNITVGPFAEVDGAWTMNIGDWECSNTADGRFRGLLHGRGEGLELITHIRRLSAVGGTYIPKYK